MSEIYEVISAIFDSYVKQLKDGFPTEMTVKISADGTVCSNIRLKPQEKEDLSDIVFLSLHKEQKLNFNDGKNKVTLVIPDIEVRKNMPAINDNKYVWVYSPNINSYDWTARIIPSINFKVLKARQSRMLANILAGNLVYEKNIETTNGRILLPKVLTDNISKDHKEVIVSAKDFYIDISYNATK